MLALAMESASSSMASGEPGTSSQGGKGTVETLDGLKVSASSFSSAQLSALRPLEFISRSTVIIEALSRAGGRAKAGTGHQTKSSNAFIRSSLAPNAQFLLNTSQAGTTQLMVLPMEYTLPPSSFCPQLISQPNSSPSSGTYLKPPLTLDPISLQQPTNRFIRWAEASPNLNSTEEPSSTVSVNAVGKSYSKCWKITYNMTLTPLPSSLHPHCLARERLHLWFPASSRDARDKQGNIVPLLPSDLQRIRDTLVHAYAEATRETYGSGLLTFHVYCDSKMIPEHQCAPVSNVLISSFITSMAGHQPILL